MKMKRSGRTILVVSLGLLVYTLFLAWYDGGQLSQADLKALDLTRVPQSLQPVIQKMIDDQDQGPVHLVTTQPGITRWSRATLPDPVIGLQLSTTLSDAYPENDFRIVHFRNVAEFIELVSLVDLDLQGALILKENYIFNLKTLISILFASLLIYGVSRMDRPLSS